MLSVLEKNIIIKWANILLSNVICRNNKCYLRGSLISNIITTVLMELFKEVLLYIRHRLELQCTMGKMTGCGWAWCPERWTECNSMAFLVTRFNSNEFLLVMTPEEACLCSISHRIVKDLMGSLQAAVTMVNANMLRLVVHCHLPWNGRRLLIHLP
jgi:hypothetical protein